MPHAWRVLEGYDAATFLTHIKADLKRQLRIILSERVASSRAGVLKALGLAPVKLSFLGRAGANNFGSMRKEYRHPNDDAGRCRHVAKDPMSTGNPINCL